MVSGNNGLSSSSVDYASTVIGNVPNWLSGSYKHAATEYRDNGLVSQCTKAVVVWAAKGEVYRFSESVDQRHISSQHLKSSLEDG